MILAWPYWISLCLILVIALSPMAVSAAVYFQQVKAGIWKTENAATEGKNALPKPVRVLLSLILAVVLLASALAVAFGGRYRVVLDQNSLKIDSLLNPDVSLELTQIRQAALKKAGDPGSRTLGYSAFGVDVGRYCNEVYEVYLRYTQRSSTVIELRTADQTVVLSGRSDQDTLAYWNEIRDALKSAGSNAQIENEGNMESS